MVSSDLCQLLPIGGATNIQQNVLFCSTAAVPTYLQQFPSAIILVVESPASETFAKNPRVFQTSLSARQVMVSVQNLFQAAPAGFASRKLVCTGRQSVCADCQPFQIGCVGNLPAGCRHPADSRLGGTRIGSGRFNLNRQSSNLMKTKIMM